MTEYRTKHLIIAGALGVALSAGVIWLLGQRDATGASQPGTDTLAGGKSTGSDPRQGDGAYALKNPTNIPLTPTAPLPSLTVPFSESYSELKRRADDGDPWAACHLGVELMRCREAVTSMEDTSKVRYLMAESDLSDLEPEAAARERKNRQQTLDRIKATALACADIPDDAIVSAQAYLRTAARSGLRQAQMLYIEGMAFDAQNAVTVLEDPAYRAWTLEAPGMLEGLVRNGDAGAVLVLSGAYRQDMTLLNTLYDPDPDKELAYLYLHALLQGNPIPSSSTRFSEQQRMRAYDEAKRMHRDYFQNRLETRRPSTLFKHWAWLPHNTMTEHACAGETPHARP